MPYVYKFKRSLAINENWRQAQVNDGALPCDSNHKHFHSYRKPQRPGIQMVAGFRLFITVWISSSSQQQSFLRSSPM